MAVTLSSCAVSKHARPKNQLVLRFCILKKKRSKSYEKQGWSTCRNLDEFSSDLFATSTRVGGSAVFLSKGLVQQNSYTFRKTIISTSAATAFLDFFLRKFILTEVTVSDLGVGRARLFQVVLSPRQLVSFIPDCAY